MSQAEKKEKLEISHLDNGGLYEENDDILKNAIAFTPDEPKMWEFPKLQHR